MMKKASKRAQIEKHFSQGRRERFEEEDPYDHTKRFF